MQKISMTLSFLITLLPLSPLAFGATLGEADRTAADLVKAAKAGKTTAAAAAGPNVIGCEGVKIIQHPCIDGDLGILIRECTPTYSYQADNGSSFFDCNITMAVNQYLRASQAQRDELLRAGLKMKTKNLSIYLNSFCKDSEYVRRFVKSNRVEIVPVIITHSVNKYLQPDEKSKKADYFLKTWYCE